MKPSPPRSSISFFRTPVIASIGLDRHDRALSGTGTAFIQKLILGDRITAGGQTRTVVGIASDTSLTINAAFPSALSGSSYIYNGYFINPIHDTRPLGDNVDFPGGSVVVTANGSSSGMVWGLARLNIGGDTLFAYDDSLNLKWCTNSMSYCNNSSSQTSFTNTTSSLPTIVNGYVYIPTGGIQESSINSTCATTTCSGLLVYHLSN